MLKHDKEYNELRETCTTQLYDFLKEETKPFIQNLFHYLTSDLPKHERDSLRESTRSPDRNTRDRSTSRMDRDRRSKERYGSRERHSRRRSMSPRRESRPCRDFERGKCPRGEMCKFSHRKNFTQGKQDGFNKRLVIEKIPIEYCSEEKVRNYFMQFGEITSISVEEHAKRAFVEYSLPEEATKAYTSPNVIFGNRFVKVYWNKNEPVTVKSLGPSKYEIAQQKKQEQVKAALELTKQKQDLIDSNLALQKQILSKLETAKPEEKAELMNSLTTITKLIEEHTEELKAEIETAKVSDDRPVASFSATRGRGHLRKPMSIDNRPKSLQVLNLPMGFDQIEFESFCKTFGPVDIDTSDIPIIKYSKRFHAESAFNAIPQKYSEAFCRWHEDK